MVKSDVLALLCRSPPGFHHDSGTWCRTDVKSDVKVTLFVTFLPECVSSSIGFSEVLQEGPECHFYVTFGDILRFIRDSVRF